MVEDLLDPSRTELSVIDDPFAGPMVGEATLREVHGPQQLLQALAEVCCYCNFEVMGVSMNDAWVVDGGGCRDASDGSAARTRLARRIRAPPPACCCC